MKEVVTGKELFDSYAALDRGLQYLRTVERRMRLPWWKRKAISLCEKLIARMERVE